MYHNICVIIYVSQSLASWITYPFFYASLPLYFMYIALCLKTFHPYLLFFLFIIVPFLSKKIFGGKTVLSPGAFLIVNKSVKCKDTTNTSYPVIAAPYVRSVGRVFALYTRDDNSEWPMDYETSSIPKVFLCICGYNHMITSHTKCIYRLYTTSVSIIVENITHICIINALEICFAIIIVIIITTIWK